LLSALQDMNMIDLPEYQEGAEKRFHVWAAEPDQDMLNWDISLANCIDLQTFVVSAKIDLVIIDSCKAVFSSAGIDYADNNLVTAVLTYFKQVICASTSVILSTMMEERRAQPRAPRHGRKFPVLCIRSNVLMKKGMKELNLFANGRVLKTGSAQNASFTTGWMMAC
jgi:hypothetical protein